MRPSVTRRNESLRPVAHNRRTDTEQQDGQRQDDRADRRPDNEVPANRRDDRDLSRQDRDDGHARKERRGS